MEGLNKMSLLNEMASNKYVKVKPVQGEEDLYACNFTRDAFRNHVWNQYTTTARGLFLNSRSDVIVRGYNKFFNINENKETTEEAIFEKVKYPIISSYKENGFLGLIAPKNEKGKFYFFTKAGNTQYSWIIYHLFNKRVDIPTQEKIWKILYDLNATMAVEVIAPQYDRHIIYYRDSRLYILDIIKNQIKLEFCNNALEDIKSIASDCLNFTTFFSPITDEVDLMYKIKYTKDMLYHEGAVYRDSNNYMFKVKSDLYKRTKALRPALTAIASGKKNIFDYKNKNYFDDLKTVSKKYGENIPIWSNPIEKKYIPDMTQIHSFLGELILDGFCNS